MYKWSDWKGTTNDDFPRLGYFTETFKTQTQADFWAQALNFYTQNQWTKSIESLLNFLRNTDDDNVWYEYDEHQNLQFALIQGSVVSHGYVDVEEKKLRVEAYLLKLKNPKPSIYRKLLEANMYNDFSKYSINDEEEILLSFQLNEAQANPNLLYNSLKEVSLNGDKIDDELINDFPDLEWIEAEHIQSEDQAIKSIKEKFIIAQLHQIEEYKKSQNYFFQNEESLYVLMGFYYKTAILLSPHGVLKNFIDKNILDFWTSYHKDQSGETLENLYTTFGYFENKTKLNSSFYISPFTFSEKLVFDYDAINKIISENISFADKYFELNNAYVSTMIVDYIVCSILYHYDLPSSLYSLLVYVLLMIDTPYFKDMNYFSKDMYSEKYLNEFLLSQKISELIDSSKNSPFIIPQNIHELPRNSNLEWAISILKKLV